MYEEANKWINKRVLRLLAGSYIYIYIYIHDAYIHNYILSHTSVRACTYIRTHILSATHALVRTHTHTRTHAQVLGVAMQENELFIKGRRFES